MRNNENVGIEVSADDRFMEYLHQVLS